MTVITFPAKQLKAALLVAGDKDVRYYLNGVCVETSANEVRLIATDGHRAGVFRSRGYSGPKLPDIIIPRDVIERLKIGTREGDYPIELTVPDKAGDRYRIKHMLTETVFIPIDGKFPDYRRIVPEEVSGKVELINMNYLADFGKVEKILVKTKFPAVRIEYNGPDAARVLCADPDFVGIVMPMRPPKDGVTYDGWAKL